MRRAWWLVGVIIVLALLVGTSAADAAGGVARSTRADYIVVLKPGTTMAAALPSGVKPDYRYKAVFNGYAATMTGSQAAALRTNPNVQAVSRDRVFHIAGDATAISHAASITAAPAAQAAASSQFIPLNIKRIGDLKSKTADIDGRDQRVNADVAVLDTGVDSTHPDLNFAGGTDCTPDPLPIGTDPVGHGTGVAGTVGAIDNKFGVVGVAPGTRIWDVRVLGSDGTASESMLVCGLDWVATHAATIDVANMSISGPGTNTPNCGRSAGDALHLAICNVVNHGVPVVVAAGNDAHDASQNTPAAYPEVITVSSTTDYDGKPAGHGQPTCDNLGADDTFTTLFSNFGQPVDISAIGTCARTTYPSQNGVPLYATFSGTSFSAPAVAGVAALYIANHKKATPAQVRHAILNAATPGPIPGDPDTYPEGLVNAGPF